MAGLILGYNWLGIFYMTTVLDDAFLTFKKLPIVLRFLFPANIVKKTSDTVGENKISIGEKR